MLPGIEYPPRETDHQMIRSGAKCLQSHAFAAVGTAPMGAVLSYAASARSLCGRMAAAHEVGNTIGTLIVWLHLYDVE